MTASFTSMDVSTAEEWAAIGAETRANQGRVADRVLAMTLHAPQILGFFRIPADQLLATPVLVNHFRNSDLSNSVVVVTDAGAGKIAGHFAKRLGLLDYWRTTGQWPDFCKAPDRPYDCARVARGV